jgi:hypothetical protein
MGQVVFKMSSDEASAVNGFMRLVDAQKKVNREVTKGGKAGKLFNQGFKGGLNSNIRGIGKMVAGVGSITTAISIGRKFWRLWQKDISDSVNSMKKFQDQFVQLQFLGDNYKRPGLRKKTHSLAQLSGIDAGQLAMGANAVQSMTGGLTGTAAEKATIRGQQLAELIRLQKTLPKTTSLSTTASGFAKMRSFYPGLTARGQSNITSKIIEEAAVEDAGQLMPYIPKMFEAGKIGGMTARTAAGVGSFLTGKTGSPADAATGFRRLSMKVMLKDPDEAEATRKLAFGAPDPLAGRKNIMKRAGVTSDDNAYQRFLKLGKLHEKKTLSVQDMKDIAGERGAAQLKSILEDRKGMEEMVGRFRNETGPEYDIVGKKLGIVRKTDPTFRRIEAEKRADAGITAAKQMPDNLLWDVFNKRLEQLRLRNNRFGRIAKWARQADAYTVNAAGGDLKTNLTNRLAGALAETGELPNATPETRQAMAEQWLGITSQMSEAARAQKEAADAQQEAAAAGAVFSVPDRNAHTN